MATAQNAFADMFKNFTDVSKFPQFDMNSSFTTLRRNFEALSTANQRMVEGLHAASRRSADITRSKIETGLKATRDLMTSGSAEQNASKQAAYVKESFESGLNDLREVCEMVAKSSFEAFDVLNKRLAESIEEISEVATKKTKKAA
jgi:phasin family protein